MKPSPRFLKALFATAILILCAAVPADRSWLPDWLILAAILVVSTVALAGFKLEAAWNLKTTRRGVFALTVFLLCVAAWLPELGAQVPLWLWSVTGLAAFVLCLGRTIDYLHAESNI